MNNHTTTTRNLRKLLGNRFFFAKWTKKNGEVRSGTFRINVRQWRDDKNEQRHLTGDGLAFDADARGLMPVWDTKKRAWRMIDLKTIIEIRQANFHFQNQAT